MKRCVGTAKCGCRNGSSICSGVESEVLSFWRLENKSHIILVFFGFLFDVPNSFGEVLEQVLVVLIFVLELYIKLAIQISDPNYYSLSQDLRFCFCEDTR